MDDPTGSRGGLQPLAADHRSRPVAVHSDGLGPRVPLTSDCPTQRIAATGMILRVLVGSTVHGTAIAGQDDRDEMGICVEPPNTVIGTGTFKHYIYRTAESNAPTAKGISPCSGPNDLDLIVYSLRRYIQLVAAGNPTMLLPLFVPDDAVCFINDFGRELREQRTMLLSRRAGARFQGYLQAQRRGLLGLRSGGSGNQGRADIRARYGFDCYLDDTEFLTRRGWLSYDEIQAGEPLATVNQSTGEVEFQLPTERVAKPYSGPIHHIRHRFSSCSVTPNHRMWTSPVDWGPGGRVGSACWPELAVWRFRPAAELRGFHHVRVVGASRLEDYPVTDARISLLGRYLSESSQAKWRDNAASVAVLNQRVDRRWKPALSAAGVRFPMRSLQYNRDGGDAAEPGDSRVCALTEHWVAEHLELECGHGSAGKHLPTWAFDLSARQADLLLDELMAGDGARCAGGSQVYYSISRRLAGDVQALAVLAGRRGTMRGPYEGGGYQVTVSDRDHQYEAISARDNVTVEEVTRRRIVCFTVPNETLVTRRNGRVAMHGNTKFAMHMVRLGYQGVELLEHGTITLPMPDPQLSMLRELRRGERSQQWALSEAERLEHRIDEVMESSQLRDHPDWDRINSWLIDVHTRYWGFR